MHRRDRLEQLMAAQLLLLLLALCQIIQSFARKQPPNIVIVMADDLGWDDVSFHGSAQIPTPNLDTLAADGIILNNYYTQPLCTPSRAALLSGMYPIHTGMQQAVIQGAEPWGLPLEVQVMPQYLTELGYETHLVGKWHLGNFKEEYTPTYRGFDSFYGFFNAEENYFNHTYEMDGQTGLDFWIGTEPLRNETGHYATTLFTQRAVNLIRSRNTSKPFFLFLSHQAPHAGSGVILDAPLRNIQKFPYIGEKNRTIYAGMVDAMDESVGVVVEALNEARMLDNTIVVFLSDNGGQPWGPHASRGSNWPLRGTKNTLWEGGCKAAAFLWSPLVSRRRRVSQQMMHVTDWLPTLYSAAGGKPGRLRQLDGQDMWRQLLLDNTSPRTELLYNIDPSDGTAALRYQNYKLVQGVRVNGTFDTQFRTTGGPRPQADLEKLMANSRVARALRDLYRLETLRFPKNWRQRATLRCRDSGNGRPSNFVSGKPPYLFDLEKDPCELKNLASVLPKVVASLQKRLDHYINSAVPPGIQPIDPRGFPDNNDGIWAPWL
ncbi:arylsulfatase B-like [Haemaphysalis longicornis]